MNINKKQSAKLTILIAAISLMPAIPAIEQCACAQIPVTGVSVPELSWVDDLVIQKMEANDINGVIVGIMHYGRIVYQRGFGWKDEARNIPLPENALVRLASCTKPITAAAIRKLEVSGALNLNDFVFDLGQSVGGIINIVPYQGTHDPNLEQVTVQHCISHTAGWDRYGDLGDYAQQPCEVASDMNIASPPGIDNTISWALGHPLQIVPPGTDVNYSNFGYMVLGKVVEIASGTDVVSYHREHVLTASMWVPATDLQLGHTFAEDQPQRETWYGDTSEANCVFPLNGNPACDPSNRVVRQYGGWDHASYVGFGGLIASAATMLEFAERYYLGYERPDTGTPLSGIRRDGFFSGVFNGTSTTLRQRTDGVNVFIFFNKQSPVAGDLYAMLKPGLDAMGPNDWPTTSIAGFWVEPSGGPASVYGSYDRPFADLDEALAYVVDGSRLNFKAGTSRWTGTISTKLQLRAPLGTVRIGVSP